MEKAALTICFLALSKGKAMSTCFFSRLVQGQVALDFHTFIAMCFYIENPIFSLLFNKQILLKYNIFQ